MRTFLKTLTVFIAIGAIGGSVMMWADPSGAGWGGEPLLQMLRDKMPWPDIFFVLGLAEAVLAVICIRKV